MGADYWVVASSCEYAPGLPVFHSRDLASWRQVGNVVTRRGRPDLRAVPSSLGLFAPTLRHDGRRFLLTSTVVGTGHFLVTAEDATGPWSDPVWLEGEGWDPSLTIDGPTTHLTWSTGHQILGTEIDPDTGRRTAPVRSLWRGTGGNAPEGPHLYHHDGRWYLVIAEGGTGAGHAVTVARASTPAGPFEPHPANPVLTHRGLDDPVQAVGHADLVEGPDGRWWAVVLGARPLGGHGYQLLGRETFLVPVRWAEGWPWFGMAGRVPPIVDLPAVPIETGYDDDFSGEWDPGWLFLRDPEPDFARRVTAPDGVSALVLHGTPDTLDAIGDVAFVGRRQRHHEEVVRVRVNHVPAGREEGGLAVRRDERHHYSLVLADAGGVRVARVVARIGDLRQTVAETPVPDGPVELAVRATARRGADPIGPPGRYRFSVRLAGGPDRELAALDGRYLSTEVAGGFTGVVIGVYATGAGRPAAAPLSVYHWHSGAADAPVATAGTDGSR